MLTVMCPNCRHRFPAPGCCNPTAASISAANQFHVHPTACNSYCGNTVSGLGGGYLVPRGYSSGEGCVINAPTIIHSPTIIQAQNVDFQGQNVFTDVGFRNGQGKTSLFRNQNAGTNVFQGRNFFPDSWNVMNQGPGQLLNGSFPIPPHCQIATTCNLTGGSVTISTPRIQSGGCMIDTTDSTIVVQTPHIEIRPNLSGGGCMVQKQMSVEEDEHQEDDMFGTHDDERLSEDHDEVVPMMNNVNMQQGIFQNPHPMLFGPPSGCQELPGGRTPSPRNTDEKSIDDARPNTLDSPTTNLNSNALNSNASENLTDVPRSNAPNDQFDDGHRWQGCNSKSTFPNISSNFSETSSNASNTSYPALNVQGVHPNFNSAHNVTNCCNVLGNPQNCAHSCANFPYGCPSSDRTGTLNSSSNCHSESNGSSSFTKTFDTTDANASTSAGAVIQVNATVQLAPNVGRCTVSITATANTSPGCSRARNNFNGGGIVQPETISNVNSADKEDTSPTTPVSWVLPFPWTLNNSSGNNSGDLERLSEAQRVLQLSGWYHEGLSWQQSANLLKDASVGSWLMRDSSDRRFMYAVSVQTTRGPTSVRVHYVCGRFRLDAEPRLAQLMPMFECPIKMIEHYIDYSKKMKEQKEVWVDHSGQLYSQIYLTKPMLKEPRSLSHLARLAVNRSKISTKELPTPLRNYLEEYPYTQ